MGYVVAGYAVTLVGLGAYAATLGQRVRRARAVVRAARPNAPTKATPQAKAPAT